MKKRIGIVLIMFNFIVMFVLLTSCAVINNKHIHNYMVDWEKDSSGHWHECDCGDKNDSASHTYGSWIIIKSSTETEKGSKKQVCSVCGYENIEEIPLIHVHSYNDTWISDETGHCHECECGDKTEIESHNIVDYLCTICNYSIYSRGLSYSLLADDTYEVIGIGTCTDNDLIIPREFNGKEVSSIGEKAFERCDLTSVIFEKDSQLKIIGAYAFWGCGQLINIEIPSSVKIIGESAFEWCHNLMNLIIPNGLESIGANAFSYCIGLKSIEIPNSITSIEKRLFYCCTGLTSVKIPNSVKRIGEYAFSTCKSLTNMKIPDSVENIGSGAFKGCNSLVSITIPFVGENADGTGNTKFEYIFEGDYGFGFETLKEVIITGGTSIGPYAFSNCEDLVKIEIPTSVTSIGEYAFYQCHGLKNIKIPEGVTSIRNNTFEGCESLISVKIPTSVTSIGERAFFGCNLKNICFLSNNNLSIGDYAFDCCDSIEKIYFNYMFEGTSIELGVGNNSLLNKEVYIYSETKPTDTTNKYWHYDSNNNIVEW